MDWQTKEHIDERIDSIEDKLDLIMQKLGVQDNEEEDIEEESEVSI